MWEKSIFILIVLRKIDDFPEDPLIDGYNWLSLKYFNWIYYSFTPSVFTDCPHIVSRGFLSSNKV